MNQSRTLVTALSAWLGLAACLVACGGAANDPEDPKPADSVDVPPNTIIDEPTLRPPGETPTPPEGTPEPPSTGEPNTPPAPPPPPPPPAPPPPRP